MAIETLPAFTQAMYFESCSAAESTPNGVKTALPR